MKVAVLFLLCCLPAFAQSPDAVKYAPRQILLVSPDSSSEGVLPMMFTTDGQPHLEFVPISQIKESVEKGGKPIRLADVLGALNEATQTINRLQAENDKLWKVAMKDNPQQAPTTVVVQQTPPQGPSTAEKYLLMRSLFGGPQTQNLNVTVRDCTRYPALCVGK